MNGMIGTLDVGKVNKNLNEAIINGRREIEETISENLLLIKKM